MTNDDPSDNLLFYSEPNSEEPCSSCKHRRYDSFHNELWCGRKPPPYNLGDRLIIGEWGHCEGWRKDDE